MAPPVAREGSLTRDEQLSRRTSANSAISNVFSDEHAYSDGDLTPVDSVQESVDFTSAPRNNNAPHITTSIPRSTLPLSFTSSERPSSTAKRAIPSISTPLPHRALSAVTDSDAGTSRTYSTSSRFSVPRSQSPYNGPSAPSQPYAMYPQVTRASSIASGSTLRAPERPFVAQGGPEHPYGMYQNTVPDEDDNDHSPHIPLGFSAAGSSFRAGSSSSGNDTGDIVGSDGHVEQLPPYSRYADNVIAKGDMGTIDPPATSLVESPSNQSDQSRSESALELTRSRPEQMEEQDQLAKKEGWLEKSKRRRCCGVPLLTVVLICFVVFGAAALGGIIGGVIGNEKGADRILASSAATSTIWLDADPMATGPSTPPCPTGHFTIALNQTQQINTCIVDQIDLGATWDCMNQAYLGLSLWDHGPGQPYMVNFDDYSLRPQLWQYGPQPPDFNGTTFQLNPVKDKEDRNLGVALFFSHLFDKLIILPSSVISPGMGSQKRSIPAAQVERRQFPADTYLAVGDKPWYCFWNATIEEFWVFLETDVPTASSSGSAMTTGSPGAAVTPAPPPSLPTASGGSSSNNGGQTSATTPSYTRTYSSAATTHWPKPKEKRSSPYSDPQYVAQFPKLIKMVEKRQPHGNIQPYCQQMQVLNDWQIMPIPTIPTVAIQESDYAQPTGSRIKRWIPQKRGSTTQELESNCICEWFSAPFDDQQ